MPNSRRRSVSRLRSLARIGFGSSDHRDALSVAWFDSACTMQAAAPKKTKATPKAAPKANAAEAAIIDSEQIPSSAAPAAIVEQATAPTASAEAAMNEANGDFDTTGWDGWM
jgi:hypothetical protein